MPLSEAEQKLSWLPLFVVAILIGFFFSGCTDLRTERARDRAFESAKVEQEVTRFYNDRERIHNQADYERLERYVQHLTGVYESPFQIQFQSAYSQWTGQESVTLDGSLRVHVRQSPSHVRLQLDSEQPASIYQDLADTLRLDIEVEEVIEGVSEKHCVQNGVIPPYRNGTLTLSCQESNRTYTLTLQALESESVGILSRENTPGLQAQDFNRTLLHAPANEQTLVHSWSVNFQLGAPGRKRVITTSLERFTAEGNIE